MSQLQNLATGSTPPGTIGIEFIQGTEGTPAGAAPGTFTTTFTSSDGSLIITSDTATHNVDFKFADEFEGSAETVGAVTADVLSVPLGNVAGTFQFEARVKAFESTTPAAAGYNVYATFITDGTNARLVGDQPVFNEDPELSTADAYFIASGNDAVLQVLGVADLTINWVGETQVT